MKLSRGKLFLILFAIWMGICVFENARMKNEQMLSLTPVAEADEIPNPATCSHEWEEWHVTKIDNTTGPGTRVHTCALCSKEESEMFMDNTNAICIPRLRLNQRFLNTVTIKIGPSEIIYQSPILNNYSVVTGNFDLSPLKQGDMIYLNTSYGLCLYRVEISEAATYTNDTLTSESVQDFLEDRDERTLRMYTVDGDAGWIIIANFIRYGN